MVSFHRICIFISLYTHIRSSFFGCLRICGHDKSAPTAACGLLITLLTNWNNVANILWDIHIQLRNALLPICNNVTFKKQKPYFYTPKTILLFCEYVTYTEWTRCEHSVKYLHSPTKTPTNTPWNIYVYPRNSPTNIPQGIFINLLRPFHQQKQLVLGFVTLCVAETIWHVLFS